MTTDRVANFVDWLVHRLPKLRRQSSDFVAAEIADALEKVDPRLGVEVSAQPNDNEYEVIITAYSEPSLFPLVREIVGLLPAISGWHFIPLKPQRGFAFTISLGKHQLQAKRLSFAPIPAIPGGIELLVPHDLISDLPSGDDAEELAWLIVETGVGEELSSSIQHIEFGFAQNTSEQKHISNLATYLR